MAIHFKKKTNLGDLASFILFFVSRVIQIGFFDTHAKLVELCRFDADRLVQTKDGSSATVNADDGQGELPFSDASNPVLAQVHLEIFLHLHQSDREKLYYSFDLAIT
jgi:hypothetical protein